MRCMSNAKIYCPLRKKGSIKDDGQTVQNIDGGCDRVLHLYVFGILKSFSCHFFETFKKFNKNAKNVVK